MKQCSACRTKKNVDHFMKNADELKTCFSCRQYQQTHKRTLNKEKARIACRKYYLKKTKLHLPESVVSST